MHINNSYVEVNLFAQRTTAVHDVSKYSQHDNKVQTGTKQLL